MNLELVATFGATAVLTIGFLSLLNPIAESINLVDHPDGDRKQHSNSTPLVGGAALLLTLSIIFILTPLDTNAIGYPTDFWPFTGVLLALLVVTHAVDDIYEINAVVRLALDGAIGVLLCTIGLLQIDTLGFLFGDTETTMGRWAVPMTVFSFIAASNAFNMTDGIDSLCTGLGIVCFTTIIALLIQHGDAQAQGLIELCALLIFALIPLYLGNLGLLGRRVRSFLGDSGARLIGFMAAIVLIYAAKMQFMLPVIAYFPIAVPVCDCLILMAVRVIHRRSPLSADRLHLHHLLMNCGISAGTTRHIILALAVLLSGLGFTLQYYQVREWIISIVVVVSFWCFIGMRWLLIRFAHKRNHQADTLERPG